MQQADGWAEGRSKGQIAGQIASQIAGQIPGQLLGQGGGSGDSAIDGRPGPLRAEMSSPRGWGRHFDPSSISGPVADSSKIAQSGDAAIQGSPNEGSAQSLAGLIHDARNMVSAMDLYCELLEEPGVLAFPFLHYAEELRLVSTAGRRLLERLAVAESISGLESGLPFVSQLAASNPADPPLSSGEQEDAAAQPETTLESSFKPHSEPVSQDVGSLWPQPASARQIGGVQKLRAQSGSRQVFQPESRVRNLAEELEASRNLLSALVGPGIAVTLTISGGRRPVAMTGDDLTRVLVNLARNAAEAMPRGGRLQIALEEDAGFMVLSFSDDGPGIPEEALETIFASGYSTRPGLHAAWTSSPDSCPDSCPDSGADAERESSSAGSSRGWPVQHRGLGLSIVRSIVAAAGGSIWATNRGKESARHSVQAGDSQAAAPEGTITHGAILVIEFPTIEPSPT